MLFNVLPWLWEHTASKAYSHFHSLLNASHYSVFGCFSYWTFLFRLMLSAVPFEMLIRLSSYEIRKLSSYFVDVRNRNFCPETINAAHLQRFLFRQRNQMHASIHMLRARHIIVDFLFIDSRLFFGIVCLRWTVKRSNTNEKWQATPKRDNKTDAIDTVITQHILHAHAYHE